MGRPSKLTEGQWEEIGARLAAGEGKSALAREYGISPATMSERFTKSFPKSEIRKVAAQLAEMPPYASAVTVKLADEMRIISANLAAAARYGSATSMALQEMAHQEVMKVHAGPEIDMESLKGVAALTRTANEAASMGISLLNANKDAAKDTGGPVPLVLEGSDVDG